MTYERLNEDERSRFIAGGTGSWDSDRWLHAVLRIAITWSGDGQTLMNCDTGTVRGRRRICDPYSRVGMERIVDGISSEGQSTSVFPMSEGDPMIVNAMDTLIRFAMTRHDVIGPLCADPDAARMMEDTIDEAERRRGRDYDRTHDGDLIINELACHMILPVIIHADDPAEDVFDAISAGYVVSAFRHPSDYAHSHTLSSCMPYEGPHCDPRLAAMWADKDVIKEILYAATAVTPVSMLITSMPDAADTGISEALRIIRSMQPEHVVQGIIPGGASGSICDSSLPTMDWDTYLLAMKNGAAAAEGLQLCEFADESDLLTMPEVKETTDDAISRMGVTWSEFSIMPDDDQGEASHNPGTRSPSMSDVAFMVHHPRGLRADPTLTWDLLHAAMYPQRYLGCGIPRMEAVASCALTRVPYMLYDFETHAIFDAAIQLHDDDMMSAADLIGRIMGRMKSMIPEYNKAEEEVLMLRMGLSQQHAIDRDRDDDKVIFLPLESVEMFLRMLRNSIPETFAMETLSASVRTFRCGEMMEPGIHGFAFIIPYPGSASTIIL